MTMLKLSNSTKPSQDETASGWDEARLTDALAKLQETHIQLRHLRDTVPSLIRPMRSELSSPETVYVDFAKAATGAVDNVRDFTTAVRDPAIQELLVHVKQIKEENPEGVVGWLATQHEDWMDKPVSLGTGLDIKREEGLKGVGEGTRGEEETREEALERFKSKYPKIKVEVEGGHQIKIVLPPPAKMTFRINAVPKEGNGAMYKVLCEETGKVGKSAKLFAGVTQAFAKRPRQDDIWHTLV
ncbi:hypothetical protein MMC10_004255 [Thelotrema lepadinum]|nr:hypothetical protein [Thelotrema lepadinum]